MEKRETVEVESHPLDDPAAAFGFDDGEEEEEEKEEERKTEELL